MVDTIVEAFRRQARWCRDLGSPFTAALLLRTAEDIDAGGALADLIGVWPGDPVADALALRFAGALHAIVLSRPESAIAQCYPPNNFRGDAPELWAAVTRLIAEDRPFLADYLTRPPQTNEVRRSAMLLGGFLEIAARTRLPLRLVEIGASAGLNQFWDRYRYRLGETAVWGAPESPVTIPTAWTGPPPRLDAAVAVAARAACDASPIDLEDPAARLRLRAYVWADQTERLALLDAAIAAARAAGVAVMREDAADFVDRRFAEPAPGQVSVLYHSVMWQYLPKPTQDRIRARLEAAGNAATASAPVAWLRMEAEAASGFPLTLTLWPDGSTETLAICHPHGAAVTWLR